jgi:beta-lactamase class A
VTATHRRPRRQHGFIAVGVVALAAAAAGLGFLVPGCAGSAAPAAKKSHDSPATAAATTGPPSTSAPATASPPRRTVSPFSARSLRAYLGSRAGHATAAVFDARTKTTWLLNRRSVQDTASIVKVEIMAAVLHNAQLAGRPLPPSQAALMTKMIENSDNQAATTLLAGLGGASGLARFGKSIGLDHTTPSTLALIPGTSLPGWGLTTTTALDQVTLLSKFAYPNSTLSGAARRQGLRLMEHIEADQGWGVSSGTAAGTTVALKNGWVPIPPSNHWQVNSIGWISGHGRDYVLAVLTDGNPSEAYGIATIEMISRAVYHSLGSGR